MDRREFLRICGITSIGIFTTNRSLPRALPGEGSVMTVLGPISPNEFGSALPHEHVLVDFIGADRVSPTRYDLNEAYEVALPYLRRVRELGCRGFVECTPAYLGRDPRLLERLAKATGLHILTNTGYYGAAKDQFVPQHAYEESANQLADRWVREWAAGIEGTPIRPGFIKTGVDAGRLSGLDRKLIQAAARTHVRTGLTIASHTGNTHAAVQQLEVLAEEGVRPDAFIWVHAQNDWEPNSRVEAARKGAWIEIDNVAQKTISECVDRANDLRQRGLLNRLLVSHDAGWYRPGEPRGGNFRGFETLRTALVPALRRSHWTAEEIRQLLVLNPATAFTVRVRRDDRNAHAPRAASPYPS
jgi:predicted metal-dependent phosphotriesterase family hydrolase